MSKHVVYRLLEVNPRASRKKESMSKHVVYRPVGFFTCAFALSWCFWFSAAYYSHRQNGEVMIGVLMLLGLFGPAVAAFFFSGPGILRQDIRQRMFRFCHTPLRFWLVAVLLVPAVIVVAILLSPLIGQSLSQLRLSPSIGVMEGSPLFSLIIIFLAPAIEELGWSSYGIDSLQHKCGNIFNSAILFGILWSLWHLPLFFIKGYYHYRLFAENPLFAFNFFVSVVPLTIITNWLYFRNDRSIPLAIIFHVSAVLSSELFMVTNETKCLVTVVCTAVAAVIIWKDTDFFFATRPTLA
ncbi:CPBP family intramembrane glutamic endopeptidase [Desulfovibrio cuneatus]|uniref:CPBP family intramembrane glutamic endopeptidase n=1 Tax=Desulfovibrio cuneatus TaxID=159728 RepID=UPI000425BA4A|nr:CPBP family intramembrane glutamic endopeptidase [Desulfovibrio cuneatus]